MRSRPSSLSRSASSPRTYAAPYELEDGCRKASAPIAYIRIRTRLHTRLSWDSCQLQRGPTQNHHLVYFHPYWSSRARGAVLPRHHLELSWQEEACRRRPVIREANLGRGVLVHGDLVVSAGQVRFGSGSGPFSQNAEPAPGVRFKRTANPEPEPAFRLGSAFECVQTGQTKSLFLEQGPRARTYGNRRAPTDNQRYFVSGTIRSGSGSNQFLNRTHPALLAVCGGEEEDGFDSETRVLHGLEMKIVVDLARAQDKHLAHGPEIADDVHPLADPMSRRRPRTLRRPGKSDTKAALDGHDGVCHGGESFQEGEESMQSLRKALGAETPAKIHLRLAAPEANIVVDCDILEGRKALSAETALQNHLRSIELQSLWVPCRAAGEAQENIIYPPAA
ncbi:hypothetical protein FB451DRAFT_1481954 [Mycena latifolia]|nr:hypothetical protein FB451DRAFT_1481954 [Mycena latifolia]